MSSSKAARLHRCMPEPDTRAMMAYSDSTPPSILDSSGERYDHVTPTLMPLWWGNSSADPIENLSPVSYLKMSYKIICLVSRRQLARDSSSVDSHVDSGTAPRSSLLRATPRNDSRISSHHPRISTQCLTRPIPVTPHPTSSSLSRWPSTAVLISAQSPLSTT